MTKETETDNEINEEGLLEHPSYEQLSAQLTEMEGERDKLLRGLAEKENSLKRTHAELDKERKFAVTKLVQDLLGVLDSMELALKAIEKNEGLELTLKLLTDTLIKYGVKVVNPEGELFNPAFHEAMTMQENAEVPDGTILMVLQKGYVLHDRVVRPAMVIVSKSGEKR